jgi:hypothetical protein
MIDGHRTLRSRLPWRRGRHAQGRPGSYQEAWDRYEFADPAVEAELVRRFDQGGCPGQMTGPAPGTVNY